ncbi:MAG: acyl carrier protein [Nannocystis sp.]|nr:phosphopantetheine-binding protein [Nannocystis sp.]MBA3548821.1 acyl carrier protein [Nannocystis sp.]
MTPEDPTMRDLSLGERVIAIIRQEVNKTMVPMPPVMSTTLLRDDLNMDSLDVIALVLDLEREFSITIPEDDIDHFWLVGDMVESVERAVRKKEGRP